MRKSALFAFGLVVTMLVTLGLVILSSASMDNGVRIFNDANHFVKNQFLYLAIGLIVAAVTACVDYRVWRERPAYTIALCTGIFIALVAVLMFDPINGSRRWLKLWKFSLQPSEFAKLAVVIALSVWLDRAGWRVELIGRGALMPAAFIGIMAGPVILEPDFGSVMVIGAVGFMLMYMAGVRVLHMLPFFAAGGAVFAYRVLTNENRMARLAAFFGMKLKVGAEVMDEAAKRASDQVHQALVAIGNGGFGGVGLNQSMQKHYYLPEAHTDFIFAIGAEELGIGFSIAVLTLFALFFVLAVYIARNAPDRYGRFLVMGMTFIVFFQAMFNIGVVCEALPTKGMALPFFSYGGTNLICSLFAVGTIISVGVQSIRERKRAYLRKVVMR